ncbi:glycoside hydrolase family 23 protein [Ramaria rubella]|nr:glycoside hydrolase family 23 protein [Ramaria rubella]
MHLFLAFMIISMRVLCSDAFNLNLPYNRRHFHALFQKRSAQPQQQQCILVLPSPVLSIPTSSGSDGDQAPLLPGPSRGEAGTIQAQSACGDIGATETISPVAGPNGAISFMTCFLNTSGWVPSFATVSDVITADLSSVLVQGNSPFEACNDYLDIIEKYSVQFKVPSILVASFAMQESGCQPDEQGEGGEQGIMQISQDKCGGAPQGNCKDPDFNVHQGTQFLANTLAQNNGNLLVTIGQYNGWYEGMTFADATAAANTSCCHCQQNLDYIFQMLNGWLLNRNPLAHPRLGEYFNLDVCS